MIAIADAIPTGWTNDRPSTGKSGQKSDVVYLFNDVDKPDILEIIGQRQVHIAYFQPQACNL
jgi:hypothetical protein